MPIERIHKSNCILKISIVINVVINVKPTFHKNTCRYEYAKAGKIQYILHNASASIT